MAARQSKLKIGIVGAGTVVKARHLPALRRFRTLKLSQFATPRTRIPKTVAGNMFRRPDPTEIGRNLLRSPISISSGSGPHPTSTRQSRSPHSKRVNMSSRRHGWLSISRKRKKCTRLRCEIRILLQWSVPHPTECAGAFLCRRCSQTDSSANRIISAFRVSRTSTSTQTRRRIGDNATSYPD